MPRPEPTEHARYFTRYIDLVDSPDIVPALRAQTAQLASFWRGFSDAESAQGPAGKWTVRQVLNHITDTERIFAYRALRIGRGDQTPLPGFEQDGYVENSGAATRSWSSLLDEYDTVRRSTLHLVETFPEEAWSRSCVSSDALLSARAAVYIIAGHELHHVALLRGA